MYPPTVVLQPITDKMARARTLQGRMEQGTVSFSSAGEWYDDLRMELLRFPAGVHDDQVDGVAWLARMTMDRNAPRRPQHAQPKSWRDKLRVGGGITSHMAS